MSDTYTVTRSTSIMAPAESIYAQLADFHNWTAWSPWEDLDPNQQRTYSGNDSGLGARYAWSGNRKAGQGNMEITEATEHSRVRIALQFLKPFKSTNTTTFELTPDGESTRIVWTLTGPNTLMIKIMGIFKSMDTMIGSDFEKGLRNLKATVEASN